MLLTQGLIVQIQQQSCLKYVVLMLSKVKATTGLTQSFIRHWLITPYYTLLMSMLYPCLTPKLACPPAQEECVGKDKTALFNLLRQEVAILEDEVMALKEDDRERGRLVMDMSAQRDR